MFYHTTRGAVARPPFLLVFDVDRGDNLVPAVSAAVRLTLRDIRGSGADVTLQRLSNRQGPCNRRPGSEPLKHRRLAVEVQPGGTEGHVRKSSEPLECVHKVRDDIAASGEPETHIGEGRHNPNPCVDVGDAIEVSRIMPPEQRLATGPHRPPYQTGHDSHKLLPTVMRQRPPEPRTAGKLRILRGRHPVKPFLGVAFRADGIVPMHDDGQLRAGAGFPRRDRPRVAGHLRRGRQGNALPGGQDVSDSRKLFCLDGGAHDAFSVGVCVNHTTRRGVCQPPIRPPP